MLRAVCNLPLKNNYRVKQQLPFIILSRPLVYNTPQLRKYSQSHRQSSGGGGGGGGGIYLTLGALIFTGGATLAYAKYDPDFRKTLTHYAPFTDDLIKTLWNEQGSGNFISESYAGLKSTLFGAVTGGSAKTRSGGDNEAPIEYKAPPPIVPKLLDELPKSEATYNEIRLEKVERKGEQPVVEIVDSKESQAEPEDVDAATLTKLEQKLCESAEEAVNAYNKAVYIIKQYNADIEYIIDEAVNHVKPETWESIRKKTRSKCECVKRAEQKAEEAAKDINKLKELISKLKSASNRELIRSNLAKVQEDIAKARKELEYEQKVGNVAEKYWNKVEEARQHFSEELECLFPSIDLSKKRLSVSEEDLDLFVLHAYSHVLYYQKELAKMETILHEKLNAAMDAARKGGGETLTNAQICEAVEQERRRLTLCFQQQILQLRKEADQELREQLKNQSRAFMDHLEDVIKTKEMEMERNFRRKFDELLESERCKFKIQLATIVGRLKGMEAAIKEKNENEQISKQAQVLWSACQALLRAIRAGCPGLPWKDQIRPLEPEINAVRKAAANNDELVEAVLNGIPKEAKERGVYPEDALRERFLKVEEVARTVALIPENGAALPVHVLSYLQSLLLIQAASPIPQNELNDEKIDFSKLSTNEILQRARYWLDRGDFTQTLRYMNLLKGAPRCVAKQWMEETRILLETQQAANTLMAHAAASGLVYL